MQCRDHRVGARVGRGPRRLAPRHRGLVRVAAASLGAAVFTTALIMGSAPARAAEASSVSTKLGEPEEREKKFLIRPFLALDQLSLDLERGDTTLSFVPNSQLAVGLRLGYSGFSISASIDVEASEDERVYGKTDYLALQAGRGFRVAGRELFISAFLQTHKGLYLENTSQVVPNSAPLVFPELTVLSLGVTASYYLNPEFSFDDTFVEFRPREHTVGSWTLRLSTGLMGYDDESVPIVPEQVRERFGEQGTLDASTALYLGAMGGYSLDFRFFESWCVAGSLLVGATLAREVHETTVEGERQGTTFAPSALFALAFGYSGETFHAGVFSYADLESYKAGNVDQNITRIAAAFFTGVRF